MTHDGRPLLITRSQKADLDRAIEIIDEMLRGCITSERAGQLLAELAAIEARAIIDAVRALPSPPKRHSNVDDGPCY